MTATVVQACGQIVVAAVRICGEAAPSLSAQRASGTIRPRDEKRRLMAQDPYSSVADIPLPRGGKLDELGPEQLARLQALADKRNQSLETLAELIRKQREAQQSIIDRMR
jgi:hypothetical protein